MSFNIKKYNFERLFRPGIVNITKPGIIIHNHPGVFGGKRFTSRSIYFFEEIFVKLYLDTVKFIGKESVSELWYEIGKDIAYRFFLNYESMKINKFNIEKVLKFFCNHFCAIGMSCCEHSEFNFKNQKFIFRGDNSVLCRYFSNPSYNAGVLSGTMSFLLNKNIEAGSFCEDCPRSCGIIVDKNILKKYIPSVETKKEILKHKPDYFVNKNFNSGLSSFSDFLRFGIVKIDDQRKFSMYDKTLIPVEIGFPGVFARAYERWGLSDLYRDSLKKSIYDSMKILLKDADSKECNIKKIRNIFSALGWGECYFDVKKDSVFVKFLSPIFIEGDVFILDIVIESFLDYLFGSNHKLIHKNAFVLKYSR